MHLQCLPIKYFLGAQGTLTTITEYCGNSYLGCLLHCMTIKKKKGLKQGRSIHPWMYGNRAILGPNHVTKVTSTVLFISNTILYSINHVRRSGTQLPLNYSVAASWQPHWDVQTTITYMYMERKRGEGGLAPKQSYTSPILGRTQTQIHTHILTHTKTSVRAPLAGKMPLHLGTLR